MYSTFLFRYIKKEKNISRGILIAIREAEMHYNFFNSQMFHVKHFNENFISDII